MCDINENVIDPIDSTSQYSVINFPSGCVGYTNDVMLSPFYEHAETDSISLNNQKFDIQLDWPDDWQDMIQPNRSIDFGMPTNELKLPLLPKLGQFNLQGIQNRLAELKTQSYILKTGHSISFYIIISLIVVFIVTVIIVMIMYWYKSLPCTKYVVMIRRKSMRRHAKERVDKARSVHVVEPESCEAEETTSDAATTFRTTPLQNVITQF